MAEAELQSVPHDRFPDFLTVARKLVTDRRSDEVGAVGIKAFLDKQIDMAEVDETQVDRNLFGFARFVAELMRLCSHGILHHLDRWYMDGERLDTRGPELQTAVVRLR